MPDVNEGIISKTEVEIEVEEGGSLVGAVIVIAEVTVEPPVTIEMGEEVEIELKVDLEVELKVEREVETEVWLEENGKENDLLGMKPSKAERAIVITEEIGRAHV